MAAGDLILVKAREEKMAASPGEGEPTRRTGHFLKPTARFGHQTDYPVFIPPPPPGSFPQGVRFRGWCHPNERWADWVGRMEASHGEEWGRAGIRAAVKASTCKVQWQPALVWALVDYWCAKTNTFVFPWGEATVTLEDVAALGGLPLLGAPARLMGPMAPRLAETNERLAGELRRLAGELRSAPPLHTLWLSRFLGGGEQLEHVAFLALWLSRFVFPGPDQNHMGRHVFPVAIRLARGERIALAPAVLAGLYRDLRLLTKHSVSCREGVAPDCVVLSPFQLLQLWVWERFPPLRPEAGPRPLSSSDPRAARWHSLANRNLDTLFFRSILESGGEFQWRPYAVSLSKFGQPSWYRDAGEWVDQGTSMEDEELLAFSRCLAPCELVELDCIEQYLPQRVARQFGFDQDLPGSVPRVVQSWKQAWATYDKPIDEVRFYVPPRMSEPKITLKYQFWWAKYVSPRSSAMSGAAQGHGSCPLTANGRCEGVSQVPGSMPCPQEKLPAVDRKRKRGRPRKSSILISSANRKGRPMLSSPPSSIDGKRKRGRPKKSSVMISSANGEGRPMLSSPLFSTVRKKKRGRPRKLSAMISPANGNGRPMLSSPPFSTVRKKKRGRPGKLSAMISPANGNGRPMLSSPPFSTVRKKKQGRPRKLSAMISPADGNGRPMLSSPPFSTVGKKKRGRPRKLSAMISPANGNGRPRKKSILLSCSNEYKSSTLVSAVATTGKKCGRPRLPTKLMEAPAPEGGNASCQHIKDISKMSGGAFANESLADASQVEVNDPELSHGGPSLNASRKFQEVYKRRKVGKSAFTSGIIDMKGSGATKDTNKTNTSLSGRRKVIIIEDDQVAIPVKRENEGHTAPSELSSQLRKIKEMIGGLEAKVNGLP